MNQEAGLNAKVLTLSHVKLTDANNQPLRVQVVFGPGVAFFRSTESPATIISLVGGTLLVLETEEQIKQLLAT